VAPSGPAGIAPPGPQIELLAHAALDPRPKAAAAWRRWCETGPAEDAGAAARRWFPAVWWNLGGPEAQETGAEVLAASYAETWGRFQELAMRAGEALAALRAAGVGSLLLKGLPLATLHYERPALRPMADVDLLVAPRDRTEALRVLAGLGYRAVRRPPTQALELMHSLGLVGPRGVSVDLHWYALLECCHPGADDELWAHAVPCPAGEEEGRAPDATDSLLTVCAHGVRWSPEAHAIWIADVATLLRRRGGAIDWERLARAATARSMSGRVAVALSYVMSGFGTAPPAGVVARLSAAGGTWAERLELRLRQRPPGLLSGAVLHWFVHRRRVRAGIAPHGPAAFARYLQAAWGLASPWRVPAAAVGRSWSRRRPGGRPDGP